MDFNPVDCFSADSEVIPRIFPDYIHRPQQEDMARAVHEALASNQILLAEAGTGVGKTLAYLVPLLSFAERENITVAVSTETRSLQTQLLNKDVPIVERLLGQAIKAEVCMGAANYVCKRKLGRILEEGSVDAAMIPHLDEFLAWEEATEDGVRHEYRGPIAQGFFRRVARDPADCLGSRCPNYSVSYYFLVRERWRRARLLVLNHSLLAAHFALGGRLLPEFSHVVIDEAHRFPDIFHGAFAMSTSFARLRESLKSNRPAAESLERFYLEFSNLFPGIPPGGRLRVEREVHSEALYQLIEEMERGVQLLEKRLDQSRAQLDLEMVPTNPDELKLTEEQRELQSEIANLAEQKRTLEHLARPASNFVRWIRREKDTDYALHAAPLHSGPLLREHFIEHVQTAVFSSATLTGPGTDPFAYIKTELGLRSPETGADLHRLRSLRVDSPFDYQNQTLLYLPQSLPDPGREEDAFHHAVAREIQRLLELTGGGAFILFTSIRSLRIVQDLLDDPPVRIISQLDAGPHAALNRFLEEPRTALFGLATFWQGVDIPGDRLRLVVLVRIPFRVPDDPLLAARIQEEREQGRDPFATIQLPVAALLVKQGFGRLIRTHSDRGIAAILDPRIRTRRYGQSILAGLPLARRTDNFADLQSGYARLFPGFVPI